jgi:hypothetical protein
MKKIKITFLLLLFVPGLLKAQTTDLTLRCKENSGPNTVFLKDYRVQLPKALNAPELRFKEALPLSKNMKYRFTLCNEDNSTGQLIMKIMDSDGRVQVASFDQKSGKSFPKIDFTCNKTGTYKIYFDFLGFQPGSGVGVVSLVK